MQYSRRKYLKQSLVSGLALGLVLGLGACSGGGNPESVVKKFYDAVADGNVDKAVDCVALESVAADEMVMAKAKIQMVVATGQAQINANGGLSKVEVLKQDLSEDGNAASMQVKVTFKNDKSDVSRVRAIKEKSGWKIKL